MAKLDNYTFYHNAYKKYGVSAKGLKWSSKERQFKRFEILLDFIKNEIPQVSILDIGCGYGDLITYIQKNMLFPKTYIGIDCEEFILDITKKRFPNSNFLKKNLLKDELPTADYYICSGALNIFQEDDYLLAIKKCYEQSSKGLIFNSLTESFSHDLTIFDIYLYCQDLAKEAIIKDNYLDNDFTIFMKK